MSRYLKVAAAQLGPVNLADDRKSVVKRLIDMLHEADARGCKLVVFTELALTTFFPRYWMEDPAEIDAFFEEEMPNAATQPLFDEARRLGIAFYLGYAELARENGTTHHYNTAVLVGPDGNIVGKYRKVHLPGHADNRPDAIYQHLEKKYFEVGDLGFPVWELFDHIMGMCICNDRRWPETYRVMGSRVPISSCSATTRPTATPTTRSPCISRCSTTCCPCRPAPIRTAPGSWAPPRRVSRTVTELIGGSCIIAPTGRGGRQALTEEDEVVSFNCDLDLGSVHQGDHLQLRRAPAHRALRPDHRADRRHSPARELSPSKSKSSRSARCDGRTRCRPRKICSTRPGVASSQARSILLIRTRSRLSWDPHRSQGMMGNSVHARVLGDIGFCAIGHRPDDHVTARRRSGAFGGMAFTLPA